MAKIPAGATVTTGRHQIPAGAKVTLRSEPKDSPDMLAPESSVGAAGRGIVQGATLGFGDEVMGAADTAIEAGKRVGQRIGLVDPDVVEADPLDAPGTEIEKPSMADVYRKARDSYRADNKKSEEAHKGLYAGGELAGGLAIPIPGSGAIKGATLAAKVGRGAATAGALGTVLGAGKSESEDIGGVAKDAALTGLLSAPFGAAGGLVEAGVSKLASRFGGQAAASRAARDEALREAIKTEEASLLGAKRSAAQAASRDMEVLARPGDPRSIPVQAKVNQKLDSKEAQEFADALALNKLESMPERMGDMASKGAEYEAFKANAPAELASRIAEAEKKGIATEAIPRLKTYATRILPPVIGSAVGAGVSDDKTTGGIIGAGVGGVVAATMGAPGTAAANMMKSPAFKIGLAELKQGAANKLAAALGKFAPIIAAEKTEAGIHSALTKAAKEDPDLVDRVRVVVEQPAPKSLSQRFNQ